MRTHLGLMLLLFVVAAPALGNDDDEQRYLELTTQTSWLEAGFIYNDVSDNSPFAYGNYKGLVDDQFYVLGNLDIFRREPWDSDSSEYYRLRGLNLGLDSRYADAEYGHQGRFGLRFLYDELPVYFTETARTFFGNIGTTNLLLPPDWVAGGRADTPVPGDLDFPTPFQVSISDNSRSIDIDWKRRKVGGGFSVVLPANLEFEADYLYERKEGNRLMAAVIGENGGDPRSVIVPEDRDYETQRFGGALRYGGQDLQLELAYRGSAFDDENRSLTWQVPFTARQASAPFNPIWDLSAGFQGPPDGVLDECVGVFGCGRGRKGQMPDNWFHQIVASGGYNLPYRTRVTLNTAFSWMLQDETYLPYTVNPNLATPIPLPRNDLDGEIFTTVIDFGIASRPLEKVRLDVGYRFEDRDNDSKRDTYVYVTSDAADQGPADGGTARRNFPYSLTRHEITFDAGYQLPLRSELILGYEWNHTERDFQERSRVWENALSAILTGRPTSFLTSRINYEHTWRDGSAYNGARPFVQGHTTAFIEEEFADLTAPGEQCEGLTFEQCIWENHPLLRKYYLADLHRDDLSGIFTVMPYENLSLAANASWRRDDYPNSELGLTEYEAVSPGLDVSYAPFGWLSAYAFYNYRWSRYDQEGWSFTGGGARIVQASDPNFRWSRSEIVHTHTAGVGVNVYAIPDRLELGIDYLFADSTGKIDVDRGSALTGFFPFPDTQSRQNNVSVYGEYHFTDNFSTRVGYAFATLSTEDWALDRISPTSLSCSNNACVIGSGRKSRDYTAHSVAWSLVFKFW